MAQRAGMTVRKRLGFILILGLMMGIGPLTTDTYLPALPSLTGELGSSPALVQLTLTGNMLGLAFGQVIIGPLSDSFGRRPPLIIGLSGYVLASVACVFAPNVLTLAVLRVLQGFGVAGSAVIASAMVRDCFDGRLAAKIFSRLVLVMGVAPMLAPSLGSAVLAWTDWRGVFVMLALLGSSLLALAVFGVRETLPTGLRRPTGLAATATTYVSLLRDRVLVGLVLVVSLSFAAFFAYISGSSFVLQEQFGLSEQQFGLVFGAGAAAMILAGQLNVRLLNRLEPQQILTAALSISSVAAVVLLVFAATRTGGLAGILAPLWVVLASSGAAWPNVSALALHRHGEAAGSTSAMLGAIQFGVAALAAPVVGVLGAGALAMGGIMATGTVAALLVLLIAVRPGRLTGFETPAREPALEPAR